MCTAVPAGALSLLGAGYTSSMAKLWSLEETSGRAD
jgi:hypothetical protein